MRIREFVDGMAIRFDSKLSSPQQYDAFFEDCTNHLKKFEGEVLGFAYQEIIYQNKSRTHPTLGKIKKICIDKQSGDYKEVNPIDEKQQEWQRNMILVKEFKETDQFKWAAQRMIGYDVLLYIERYGKNPSKHEVDLILKSHEKFKENMRGFENDPELSEGRLAIYKMGKTLNGRNLDYFNEHKGQYAKQ